MACKSHIVLRKILLINGALQIGKSYLIRHVGTQMFRHFIEINLKEDAEGAQVFKSVKSKEDFYMQLGAIAGNRLNTQADTLIFLDEIQSYPHMLTMLKSMLMASSCVITTINSVEKSIS